MQGRSGTSCSMKFPDTLKVLPEKVLQSCLLRNVQSRFSTKRLFKHRPQPLGGRVLLRRLMRILTNAGITFLALIVRITKPLSGRWWSGMRRNQKPQGSDVKNARKIGQNPSALNQSRRASEEQLRVIEQWQDFISQDCCRHS